MRRVWYTFALSVMVRPTTVHGFLFGASLIAFWKLVSIMSIVQNFLSVPVGSVPAYLWQSFAQAESFALLAFGIIVFTILSVGIRVPKLAFQHQIDTQSA